MRFHCLHRPAAMLTALVCLTCATAARAQVVLDFENLSVPTTSPGFYFQGYSVTQDGFTVTDTFQGRGLWSVAPPNSNTGFNYTGSTAMYESPTGGYVTLTQNDGGAFTLISMDTANLGPQRLVQGGVNIVFTGDRQDGAVVTQSYQHGSNDALETVVFGSDFTDLVSVTFDQEFPGGQFDNIRVTSVPEPGSIALFCGLGATGAGFLVRRRRARPAA